MAVDYKSKKQYYYRELYNPSARQGGNSLQVRCQTYKIKASSTDLFQIAPLGALCAGY